MILGMLPTQGWPSRGAREDAQHHPDASRDDTQRTTRGGGREDASQPSQGTFTIAYALD